jgi:hypothetical protein
MDQEKKLKLLSEKLGEKILHVVTAKQLPKYFPGTSYQDWLGWVKEGAIKTLPHSNKVPVINAAKFLCYEFSNTDIESFSVQVDELKKMLNTSHRASSTTTTG